MPSRRSVLRTVGAGAAGAILAGPVGARSGEQLPVSADESALVMVDLRLSAVPDSYVPASLCGTYPVKLGADKTAYVSESTDLPAFDLAGDLTVAERADRLTSVDANGRLVYSGRPRTFLTDDGAITATLDSRLAVDATGSPGSGVDIVAGSEVETVDAGDRTTVELPATLRYVPPGGGEESFEATVLAAVEHAGVRTVVAHPDRELVPEDHTLGRAAAHAFEQANDGELTLDRSTHAIEYDDRGFFAHEQVETNLPATPSEPGPDTHITDAEFIGTDEYGGTPQDAEDAAENTFSSDTDSYLIAYDDDGVDLGSPADFDEAWEAVKDSNGVEDGLEYNDAVMVVDDRSLSGPSGRAFIGTAGGSFGFGYSEDEDTETTTHELGHIYGCSHEGSTTHWQRVNFFTNDVMGYYGVAESCNGKSPMFIRDLTYEDCASDRIDSYVENEL